MRGLMRVGGGAGVWCSAKGLGGMLGGLSVVVVVVDSVVDCSGFSVYFFYIRLDIASGIASCEKLRLRLLCFFMRT